MNSKKKLGIWMDYSSPHLIDPDKNKNQIIESKFSSDIQKEVMKKGEKHLHNKEEQFQQSYFNEIADQIRGYDQVLLFGPTNAKKELNHYLNEKEQFKHVKIALESADKMTENEKNAFVKKHFND